MRFFFVGVFAMLALAGSPSAPVEAASWCAQTVWAHEWGVQAFDASGAPAQAPVVLPPYFHRSARGSRPSTSATRHLPPDSGIRLLPVLHFYASGNRRVPIGLEVGFTQGRASVWYPQVDARRSPRQANSRAATRARETLVAERAQLNPMRGVRGPRVPSDPTRQLVWDELTLTPAALNTPPPNRVPWVDALRAFPAASWVNRQGESERFVFYEADTRERVALSLRRGPSWRADHRHIVIRNTGSAAVHDVFVTHRERGETFVLYAPSIPAARDAGFVLEEHRVARSDFAAATRGRLRTQLIDPAAATVPPSGFGGNCSMMRDPAIPMETTASHRLLAHEVDVLLDIWGATFFDAPGTTITYREDTAYLDQVMPLSIYTDMYHHIVLRRAGLAVWTGVALP